MGELNRYPQYDDRSTENSNIEVSVKEIHTSFNKKKVFPNEEYYVVFLKKANDEAVFSLNEVYDHTDQYIVHAEDLNEFIFDKKNLDSVWTCEPVMGKKLTENGGY